MSNDIEFGRICRRHQKEIAQHYREEYDFMRRNRETGIRGRIEFGRWEPNTKWIITETTHPGFEETILELDDEE